MKPIKVTLEFIVDTLDTQHKLLELLTSEPNVKIQSSSEIVVTGDTLSPAPKQEAAKAPATEVPAPKKPKSPAITIEDVRRLVSAKVSEHRDVIKQKLTELGAPSVTTLNPEKYSEMFNFLNTL